MSASTDTVDMKLEAIMIPVSDVERAKRFYGSLGWRLDLDVNNGSDFHGVQMTPPHSNASILFGKGVTTATPGSVQGMMLVVDDIEAARAQLIRNGVEVSDPFHFEHDKLNADDAKGRLPGRDPQHRSYLTWASFKDPDGNGWLLQEVTQRLPGRLWEDYANGGSAELESLLREAEKHHGEYERTAPKHHWSPWYATYVLARQHGKPPEEAAREAAAKR